MFHSVSQAALGPWFSSAMATAVGWETVVGRALEKEADRRYASAAALAEDVARYLTSQPILARPPSAVYQLRKFAKRNKALVGGLAATLVAIIGGAIGTLMFAVKADQQRQVADEQRRVADEQRQVAEAAAYRLGVRAAADEVKKGKHRAARLCCTPKSKIVIIGQAPGTIVHKSDIP